MDWRKAGYQMAKGADDLDRDLSVIRIFAQLFCYIIGFGIAVVALQTIVSWAVGLIGLIGPLVGIVLVGYIAIKVLAFFARK